MLRKRRGLSAGGDTPDAAVRQLWFCMVQLRREFSLLICCRSSKHNQLTRVWVAP
jgi:hypothetical protein